MIYGHGKFTYELVDGWAQLPPGESFVDVSGVCTDPQGRVYVLSRSTFPILVFDREGHLLSRWGKGLFQRAHGSCIAPDGSIWCTDDRNHTVTQYTPEGTLLKTLGTKDKPSDTGYRETGDVFERLMSITHGGPPFNRPTGVAIGPSGDIYVCDGYANCRVHRFNAQGELLASWGEPGSGPGEFRLPHNLYVDKWNRVWVADRENHRVQIFREDGRFLTQWTDLYRPTDVRMDAEDVVYVTELPRRISIFTLDGRLLARWGNEGHSDQDRLFVAPHALAVDARGDLYVGEVAMTHGKVDRGARTLQKFARRR